MVYLVSSGSEPPKRGRPNPRIRNFLVEWCAEDVEAVLASAGWKEISKTKESAPLCKVVATVIRLVTGEAITSEAVAQVLRQKISD